MLSKNRFSLPHILIVFLLFTSFEAHSTDSTLLITPINYEQWNKQLQNYRPNIVVVDMWAMWCTSCIEQFPDMVTLHNKYRGKNITFISMNLDDREDKPSLQAAEIFLRKMKAEFDHFRMDENLMVAFEKNKLIGIPAVLVYNQQGEEAYRFTGDNPNKQFTKKDIEQALDTLLSH